MPYVDPASLRDALTTYYSESELRGICFDLGIDYESLGGRGKADNAQELVNYALRKNRYDEIVAYVRRTRAHAPLQLTDTPPKLPEAVERTGSGGTTHVYQGSVYQGNVGNVATDGGIVNDSSKKVEVHAGNIIGNIGDGAFHNEGNIAMGDIVLGGQTIPQTRDEFGKQLAELQALLTQAVSQNEFTKEKDGEKAVAAAQEVAEEAATEEPDTVTITSRLDELKRRLEGAATVVVAAGQTGKAILKALPIIGALIKLAKAVF